MRALLLLAVLAALPARSFAVNVCYYNHRQRVVEPQNMTCVDNNEAKFDIASNFRFSCGVTNTFNLFSKLCERPCQSAMEGVRRYGAHGKTVVYGPALLPLSPDSKYAFVLYNGDCYSLREKLRRGEKPSFENITDDDLISAANLAPPARR